MRTDTALAQKIIERADRDGLADDHALRRAALAFELATNAFYAPEQTATVAQFVGAWARARRAWCAYSGEPLV